MSTLTLTSLLLAALLLRGVGQLGRAWNQWQEKRAKDALRRGTR